MGLPITFQLIAGVLFIFFATIGGGYVILRALWQQKFEILFALIPAGIELSFAERHFFRNQALGHPLASDLKARHPFLFLCLVYYLHPRRLLRAIVSLCGIVAAAILIFSVLGTILMSLPSIVSFDSTLLNAIAFSHSVGASIGMGILTVLGEWYLLGLFGVVLTVWWWEKRNRLAILPFWFVYLGTLVATQFVKLIVGRARPTLDLSLPEIGFSFPSSHAALSFAVFAFLIFLLVQHTHRVAKSQIQKKLHILLLVLIIVTVGVSRVYLGVHFPTDVLVGWLLGGFMVAWGALLYTGMRHYFERGV